MLTEPIQIRYPHFVEVFRSLRQTAREKTHSTQLRDLNMEQEHTVNKMGAENQHAETLATLTTRQREQKEKEAIETAEEEIRIKQIASNYDYDMFVLQKEYDQKKRQRNMIEEQEIQKEGLDRMQFAIDHQELLCKGEEAEAARLKSKLSQIEVEEEVHFIEAAVKQRMRRLELETEAEAIRIHEMPKAELQKSLIDILPKLVELSSKETVDIDHLNLFGGDSKLAEGLFNPSIKIAQTIEVVKQILSILDSPRLSD
jgi:hypothetical protein